MWFTPVLSLHATLYLSRSDVFTNVGVDEDMCLLYFQEEPAHPVGGGVWRRWYSSPGVGLLPEGHLHV